MAGKCGNLRRLSLILLAAERNHYLGLLPAIQERLVEMLRSGNVSARVHSEVRLRDIINSNGGHQLIQSGIRYICV